MPLDSNALAGQPCSQLPPVCHDPLFRLICTRPISGPFILCIEFTLLS